MKTKIITRFLAIAFLLLGSQYANAQCSQYEAWNYAEPITVQNTADSGLANYQVKVVLTNTGTLVSNNQMNSDGSDIRFADADCNNLPYWVQNGTFGTANCIIWVKTLSIPASATQTINMYYGNAAADTVVSNGNATFDLFDDFTKSVTVKSGKVAYTEPDTSKWVISKPSLANFTVANSIFTVSAPSGGTAASIYSKMNFSSSVVFEADATAISGANGGNFGIGVFNLGGYSGYTLNYTPSTATMSLSSASGCSEAWTANSGTSNTSPGTVTGAWGLAWPVTGSQNSYWNGDSINTNLSDISVSSSVNVALGMLCSTNGTGSASFDWVRVRKYAKVAPVITPGAPHPNVSIVAGNISDQCAGSSISISYTASGLFNADNNFIAQISDASGSFSTPDSLSSVNATGSGNISATLPAGLSGSGFLVRIVSTDPAYTSAPNSTSFAINPLPIAGISGNTAICAGSTTPSVSVSVSNTSGMAWSLVYNDGTNNDTLKGTGDGNATITASNTATTTYTLKSITETNGTGCSSTLSGSATVTVNPLPTASISGSTTICSGVTAPALPVAVSNTSGMAWSLVYSDGTNNHTLTGTGDGTADITASNTATTTYSLVSITETNGTGCSNNLSGSAKVTVNAAPAADAGSDQTVCSGNSVQIGSSSDDNSGSHSSSWGHKSSWGYSWGHSNSWGVSSHKSCSNNKSGSGSNGSSSSSSLTYSWSSNPTGFTSTSADPTVAPTGTTTYTLTVTNSNGCSATDTVTVTVSTPPSVPTITPNGPTTFCSGGSVTLTSSNGGTGASYSWSNQNGPLLGSGSNTSSIKVTCSGTYYVTVTNHGGCSATSKGTVVTVNSAPKVSICGDQNYNYGYDNNVNLSASCDHSGATFNWSCGGKSCSKSQNWSCSPSSSCSYTCTATANGCASAPVSCNVSVNDCHDYNYSDHSYPSKCSMCYYNSYRRQYCQTYVYKSDVSSCEKNGYKFGNCGSGTNLDGMSADEINIYPNPFSATTNIRLNFVQDEQVKVDVISMEGRVISTVYDGAVTSGIPYNFTFDGTQFMSGMYMVRVISGTSVEIRKITLVKN